MRIYIPIFEIKHWACYESKWEGMFIKNKYFGWKKLNRLCSFKEIVESTTIHDIKYL